MRRIPNFRGSIYKSGTDRCPLSDVGDNESMGTDWATQLYDACAAELVLYGRALGLGHAEAEDVLHDTFRSVLGLATPPREPRFYLVRSFRNRALNYRRGVWRRLLRELESRNWFEGGGEESPNERVAVQALQGLPPDQREVIVLKVWHGLTFEAIGSVLGLSPNTAAGRYRYGIQKLRLTLRSPSSTPSTNDEHLGRLRKHAAWLPAAPALPEN